jgi:uncharacterized membrane protein YhaH (DUF805 family)
MLRFYGRIGRARFAWGAGLRIALYIASVAGFPFFLAALASITGCRSVGGACGAVGLIGSMAFKPIVFVLFDFSFVGICLRRVRDAGMPAWIGLAVPLFFAADYVYLVYAGTPWSFGFATGVLYLSLPYHALLALACIVFLCLLPTRVVPPGTRNPFGAPGLIAFALGALIAINAVWKIPAVLLVGTSVFLPMMRVMWPIGASIPYVLAGFVAALVFIAWRERRYRETEPLPPLPKDREPIASLLALALVLTLFLFHLNLPKELQPWWLAALLQLTSVILPTLALNFMLVLAIWLVIARRKAWTVALLVCALLPFAHWGYARWAKELEIARERADVAGAPARRPDRLPVTIVVDGSSVTGLRAAWAIPQVQSVVSRGAYSAKLMQFERPEGRQSTAPRPIDALPAEYLLLRVGRSSRFAKERQIYAAAGGPFELRFVSGERDDLLAVWYRTFNPEVADVPLLTSAGWLRPGANSATAEEIEESLRAFLLRALAS